MIATPLSSVHLRLITTADYHRMAEIGILGADEQVELIAGQIIQKMPKVPAHSPLCKRMEKRLEHHLGDRADEVYLIVKIADTTIDRDLSTKANLYAVAGITDYWVFNITSQQLHIFQDPQPNGYQRQLILLGQQSVSPLAFPDCTITVQECF